MLRLAAASIAVAVGALTGCGSSDDDSSSVRVFAFESVQGALNALPYAEPRGRTQVIVATADLEKAADGFLPPVTYAEIAAGDTWFAELRDGLDRFAVRDPKEGEAVATSTESDWLEDWRAEQGRRLLDNEQLADVADVFDDRAVHAAYLVAGSFDQFRGHPPKDAIDEEFEAAAIGFSGDGLVHVAYWFDDDLDVAERQVESTWRSGTSRATYRPLSDLARVRDVHRDGHVVTVDLEPGEAGPAAVFELLSTRDTPFQNGK